LDTGDDFTRHDMSASCVVLWNLCFEGGTAKRDFG
jgi:hypothetical protein